MYKKLLLNTIIGILFLLVSCDNGLKHSEELNSSDTVLKTSPPIRLENKIPDSIKRFIVDDYPVTDEMFGYVDNAREIKSGPIRSLDKAWFSNDTLSQTLVFELYTDYHRMVTFHFFNNSIPKEIIERIELHTDQGEIASEKQKEFFLKGFLNAAKRINRSYFTTNKNIKLGDKKVNALKIYGKPDKISKSGNVETYEWNLTGDLLYDGKANLMGKPLAKHNYGHQVLMFFENDKLMGTILFNDIP